MSKHAVPAGGDGEAMDGESRDFPALDIRDSVPMWSLYTLFCTMAAVVTTAGGVYLLALLFAVAGAWGLSRVLWRPPRVRITEDGIVDKSFWSSPGLIRWDEIVDVRRTKFWMIEIDLVDEAAFWERLSPLQHLARWKFPLYGFGPAALLPLFLEPTRREIIDALQAGLDEYTLTAARREGVLAAGDPTLKPGGDSELPPDPAASG